MDMMALTLLWSISIPRELITYPKSLPEVTPKAHLAGFSLMLYLWSLSKNFLKGIMCPRVIFGFDNHIIHIDLHFFIHHVV